LAPNTTHPRPGEATISCGTGYGGGGLGQHLAQVVEEARAAGRLSAYYAGAIAPGDAAGRVIPRSPLLGLAGYTPLRFSWARTLHLGAELFDRAVARSLRGPIDTFVGFGGLSLHSFRRARELGARRLELHAANSHVGNVMRQHARALADYPFDSPWIGRGQVAKTLKEYELADLIWVASEYTRQSFLDAGFPQSKLARFHLQTAARFVPPQTRPDDGIFRVVYVGGLTVGKGVPLLVRAFSRLKNESAKLTLVGGVSSRGMKRFLKEAMARDPRIVLAPGDPLPHLWQADVYVHPTYEDGWAYAPAEALACGVPVIVTHDTGMKELVHEGENGYVVPTGDEDAIHEGLSFAAAQPAEPMF
jgi:glycosyltransferase involved in cell wall biosynthesis